MAQAYQTIKIWKATLKKLRHVYAETGVPMVELLDRMVSTQDHEREEAIIQLRRLCETFGDNEWSDDLNLADVIEKHLGRHLYAVTGKTACLPHEQAEE